jgi:hypothetical protein
MVAGNETFFQVVPQKSLVGGPASAPAAAPAAPAQRTVAAH